MRFRHLFKGFAFQGPHLQRRGPFFLCFIVGLIMPSQTLFQLVAGIEIPLPVIMTKALSFFLLAAYALWLIIKLSVAVRVMDKN